MKIEVNFDQNELIHSLMINVENLINSYLKRIFEKFHLKWEEGPRLYTDAFPAQNINRGMVDVTKLNGESDK